MATQVTAVRARKSYECEKCGKKIQPGEMYRWYKLGFRSNLRRTRCMQPVCTPKRSELVTSKLSAVYAAVEDAEADINACDTVDGVEAAVASVGDICREIAEEYREAAVNPDTGVEFNPDNIERADTLDGIADELESWSCDADEREECSIHGSDWVDEREDLDTADCTDCTEEESCELHADECEECEESRELWLDGIRTAGHDALYDIVSV